jgi:glycerophosphoryl diester phosphodiesterase
VIAGEGGASRPAALARLGARPFAHRGLHGDGRIENSRAAFAAAIAAGSGIELDVQASRDGAAFVFHDARLGRLSGTDLALAECTAAQLAATFLAGSDETIPRLGEVLRLIAGRTPLLIEIKSPHRRVAPLCRAVADALVGYDGPVGIMSFNPEAGAWFARNAPARLRGLVVSEKDKKGLGGRIERSLSLWRSAADFLAYDIGDLPSAFAAAARRRGLEVFTWTVRSAAERERAAREADQIIYEQAVDEAGAAR